MLKRLTVLLSLILALGLTASVAAQTPASDAEEALDQIDSDVAVYGRSYEGDLESQPEEGVETPLGAIIQIYEFDDEDAAEEAIPHVEQLMKDELEPAIDADLETEEVDDLGDSATLSTAEVTQDGESISVALYLVQEGELIYLSAGIVYAGDAEPLAGDLLDFMLDSDAESSDDAEFNEDGTSTGGYFDAFPTEVDEDVLGPLVPTEDMYETTF